MGPQQQLPIPVGKWKFSAANEVGWFMDSTGDQLYHLTHNGWASFTLIPSRCHTQIFQAAPWETVSDQIPSVLEKETVYTHGDMLTLTGHNPIDYTTHRPSRAPYQNFWDTWGCEYCIEGKAKEFSQAIQQGFAIAVINPEQEQLPEKLKDVLLSIR